MENLNYSYLLERNHSFKKERRINKRFKYDNKFKLISIDVIDLDIYVQGVDISISGIGFIADINFRINNLFEVILDYKGITIPSTVKIIHSNLYDMGFYVGCEFIAIPNLYRNILKKDLECS